MTSCPICRRSDADKKSLCKVCLHSETAYDLIECAACGAMRFDPLPPVAELAHFYNADYYDFDRHKTEGKGMAFAKKYLARQGKTGKFLDVGCATGFFINGIRRNSEWEVFGVDFGAAAVRYARKRLGLNVTKGDLTETNFETGFFDFVHVNNVLEHVRDPLAVLRECRRILKPDGAMYLSVPNGYADSRDLIAFYESEKIPARSKSGHIFFFPAQTLLKMLAETGFIVQRADTYGIRRGLRSLGWYPQKNNWKKPYYPQPQKDAGTAGEEPGTVTVPDKRKHSDFYYRYRFAQLNLKMLSGLRKFGLDYQLFLRPANK